MAAVYPQSPYNPFADIVNANGTAIQTIITAPAASGNFIGGCILKNVRIANDDSNARTVQFLYNDKPVGQLAIPANTGLTNPPIDLFSQSIFSSLPFDALGNRYLQMSAGDTLKWNLTSGSVTTAKKLSFITLVGAKL